MSSSKSRLEEALDISESEVHEARGARDYDAGGALESTLPLEVAQIPAEIIAKQISTAAHDLVVRCEVTSQEFYERRYQVPIWPGLSSGITIGIGFDVGQHNSKDFEEAWKPVLAIRDYERLAETVGVTGSAARDLIDDLDDIRIDWPTALKVYHSFTVPKFGRITANAFPQSLALHPDSFGALFSLVCNRGPGMNGERRVHMRNIRGHVIASRASRVPGEFRDMKRLWTTQFSRLLKRRDAEALLFEQGLLETDRGRIAGMAAVSAAAAQATALAGATAPTAGKGDAILSGQMLESQRRTIATETDEHAAMRTSDGDGAGREVDFSVEAPVRRGPELESTSEWASVSWARTTPTARSTPTSSPTTANWPAAGSNSRAAISSF